MKSFRALFLAATISVVIAPCAQSADGQFIFTVGGLPPGEVLNVRKNPKPSSTQIGIILEGEQGFSCSDCCRNSKTGKKIKAANFNPNKPNTWCYVTYGDDNQLNGWVRAKFLK